MEKGLKKTKKKNIKKGGYFMKKIISVLLVAFMLAAMFVPMNVSAAASVAWTNTSELWTTAAMGNSNAFAEKVGTTESW